jgi:hypothetical protein
MKEKQVKNFDEDLVKEVIEDFNLRQQERKCFEKQCL